MQRKSTEDNSFASLVTNFGDFLTVAVHSILYERHIYPLESFITVKKWNYPIRQSRHPKVCKWITDAVVAVQEELLKGTVDRVAVVIFSQYAQPLERFLFDVSKFPIVAKEDYFTPIRRLTPDESVNATPTPPSINLEEQFRAVMAKLSACDKTLGPIPSNCTFTIAVELKDSAKAPVGHPQPWMPVPPSLQKEVENRGSESAVSRSGSDLGGVATTPMWSVHSGEMMFESWIEETEAKEEYLASLASTQETA